MGDVFQVQDDLARQVVDSLALPLTGRERGLLDRDVTRQRPRLRAVPQSEPPGTRHCRGSSTDGRARAVCRLPGRGPAVRARLGANRSGGTACSPSMQGQRDEASIQRAREAFERAFALNPQLPLAHHLYTHFEIEELGRADTAMIRLLSRVRDTPTDADLLCGPGRGMPHLRAVEGLAGRRRPSATARPGRAHERRRHLAPAQRQGQHPPVRGAMGGPVAPVDNAPAGESHERGAAVVSRTSCPPPP